MNDIEKKALVILLEEIVAILCYSIHVPHEHKQELVEKLSNVQGLLKT